MQKKGVFDRKPKGRYLYLKFDFFFRVKILKKPNKAGISHADIIHEYLVALKKDVPNIGPNSKLFWRGNAPTPTNQASKFQAQFMGAGKLMEVAREIATFLGLVKPENYMSHSIRHTAATLAAQRLATAPQMMVR